jgi:2-polyprenyl-6-hydroxyphenyl methylase/3-demethylubiquinone-9 3-methyltransferase
VSVGPGGRIFIAIYNHQPLWTPVHTWLKRTYVTNWRPARPLIAAPLVAFYAGRGLLKDLVLLRNPLARYRNYDPLRGMSWWHDCTDWIGGYPFETATPRAILDFFRQRGFISERVATCGRKSGCNQFVFRRLAFDPAQQGGA